MTNSKQKKKGGVNPVFATVTGAVIVAGAAVAGAFALKDKKNRNKVKKVLTNVKDQAVGYMEKIQKEAKKDAGIISKKAAVSKKNIKKTVKDIKKDVTKGVKKI